MKEIPFAPGYFCDQYGNFVSKKQNPEGKPMKVTIHHTGYAIIGFMIDCKLKQFKAHRVVALTHLPNPNNLPVVDHIDRNRSNYKLSNLRWVDYSTNGKNSSVKKIYDVIHFTEEELNSELWKKSSYFDGYGMRGIEVSNLGRYKYYYRGQVLKIVTPKKSNNYTSLKSRPINKIGDSKRIQLHKLVWITFNGDFDNKSLVINHIDGNKDNNRLSNLELLTYSENILHAHKLNLVTLNKVYKLDLVEKIFEDFYINHIPVYKVFKKYKKGSNDVTKLLRGDHEYYQYTPEQFELTKSYKYVQSLIMSNQAKKSSVVKVRDIKVFEKIIYYRNLGYPVRKIATLIGSVGSSFVHHYVKNNFENSKKEYPHLKYE
jgi:hypothetical protein